jgi:hypothetical protein
MTDQNTLAQPQQISADGQWRWDGAAWVPNTPQTAIPQPPAPQKQKMGLGKKVLIGVGALVLIGAATNMGGGDDTASTAGSNGAKHGAASAKKDGGNVAAKGDAASKPAAATPDNTTATANGPLVWGNWETVGPIEPKNNGLDMFGLAIRVKNTGESTDQGIFQATLLKKNRILATFDCISADEIAPGATTTVDCLSTDDFVPGWDEITIEDAI